MHAVNKKLFLRLINKLFTQMGFFAFTPRGLIL